MLKLVGHGPVSYNSTMAEAIEFDTHRFVKRLTESGFTEQQAETLAEEHVALLNANLATKTDVAAINSGIEALRLATRADMAEIRADIEARQLSTKADIEALRQETKADIEALRQETKADMEALRQETKADMAGIRADIEARQLSTKADIETLRQETRAGIEALKADLLKWIFGALIVQGGLVVALVKIL